jgi:hypothetical protein
MGLPLVSVSKALNLEAWPKPNTSHGARRHDMTRDSAGPLMAALNPATATVRP